MPALNLNTITSMDAAEVAAARGPQDYSSKSVAELLQLVTARGLTAPPRARKDDLIALLTA